MKLVHTQDGPTWKAGDEVKLGDCLLTFRGESAKVTRLQEPRHEGSTGRIYSDIGAFFPSIFNCKWVGDDE